MYKIQIFLQGMIKKKKEKVRLTFSVGDATRVY